MSRSLSFLAASALGIALSLPANAANPQVELDTTNKKEVAFGPIQWFRGIRNTGAAGYLSGDSPRF